MGDECCRNEMMREDVQERNKVDAGHRNSLTQNNDDDPDQENEDAAATTSGTAGSEPDAGGSASGLPQVA